MLTSAAIRQQFLDFFREKQHTIVPSSSLLPDSPNLLFTNAGMNQFVPIFLGETRCPYSPGRAADTQKCIRAGGKHNDLDDVGLDTYHHTFFEMLGNWSFGDYFKKDAIEWAWELIVERWKFPAARVYATVYSPDKSQGDPSDFDQEAWDFWAEKFRAAGLDPAVHIVPGNKKDNFWMMGETGPCGPCSELHIDLTPEDRTPALEARGASLVNTGVPECIEIWNLVFIQFNANPDGTFTPLPAQHVDTGMGFERVTSIIQGTKGFTDFQNARISNYDTDIFRPIFDELEKMSGKTYRSTLPGGQKDTVASQPSVSLSDPDVSLKQQDASLKQQDASPKQPDASPKQPDSDTVTKREDLHPQRHDFPLQRHDLHPQRHDFPLQRHDLHVQRDDLHVQRDDADAQRHDSLPQRDDEQSTRAAGETKRAAGETKRAAGETKREDGAGGEDQIALDVAFRVIADHIRTLSFAIADGIQPGNTDRHYVLRRILRRAVRYGRTLGFREPFFYKLVAVLAREMGGIFPALRDRQRNVEEVLKREEDAFNKTLDRGIAIFEEEAARLRLPGSTRVPRVGEGVPPSRTSGDAASSSDIAPASDPAGSSSPRDATTNTRDACAPRISGAFAFQLYDTYGFPLDLTELMARERGLTVDTAGFAKHMEEQRARARAAQKKQVIELSEIETKEPTLFVGYDALETAATVLEVVTLKDKTAVILDASAAYAEMGGQVGDTGELTHGAEVWRFTNTQKSGATWLHFLKGEDAPVAGTAVELLVDPARRAAIQRHHTVTHLLHWALHEVVSREATQKGSFVGPDKLTFDFNSAALTPAQVRAIERRVNESIVLNSDVWWREVPYADVRGNPQIMQFFGDKYGETVRVVQIGGHIDDTGLPRLDGYSMELCAGTHTRSTGEIGLFRITSEAAIAAGVRRIEAVAGLTAYDAALSDTQRLHALAGKIGAPLADVEKKLDALLSREKELERALKSAHQREAAGRAKELLARVETIGGLPAIIANLGEADGDALQTVADALKGNFAGVVVLGGSSGPSVALVASVSSDYTAKVQAGKIISAIAPLVGGKGGGKPESARGGGKDPAQLETALAHARTLLS